MTLQVELPLFLKAILGRRASKTRVRFSVCAFSFFLMGARGVKAAGPRRAQMLSYSFLPTFIDLLLALLSLFSSLWYSGSTHAISMRETGVRYPARRLVVCTRNADRNCAMMSAADLWLAGLSGSSIGRARVKKPFLFFLMGARGVKAAGPGRAQMLSYSFFSIFSKPHFAGIAISLFFLVVQW